jgi:hypothetical protein
VILDALLLILETTDDSDEDSRLDDKLDELGFDELGFDELRLD